MTRKPLPQPGQTDWLQEAGSVLGKSAFAISRITPKPPDTLPQLWMPQLILAILGAVFTTVPLRIEMRKRANGRASVIG